MGALVCGEKVLSSVDMIVLNLVAFEMIFRTIYRVNRIIMTEPATKVEKKTTNH